MEFTELPNRDRAFVDLAKLQDYCLNAYHQDGKHKARVFKSALGVDHADAEWLRERILGTVVEHLEHDGDRALLVEFSDKQGQTYAMVPL